MSLEGTQRVMELIGRCVAGDAAAAREFQETYGEMIYAYPRRVYRVPADDAGDFYVFAFEKGRLFRRVRTYEGRAPFRAYLCGFVLDDLVLEWMRTRREVETVPIDDVERVADPPAAPADDGDENAALLDHVAGLEPAKAVVLKLLYIEDHELNAAELQHALRQSGLDLPGLLARLDRLRASVRDRESKQAQIFEKLDTAQAWLELYERKRVRMAQELAALPATAQAREKLAAELEALDRRVAQRRHQRDRLIALSRRRKTTAPYKEIAELLNTSVGNLGSLVTRLRQELARKIDRGRREATPGR